MGGDQLTTFAVAGLQLELPNGDNRLVIEDEIRTAKGRYPWLDMIVLPELASFGTATQHAQRLPGPAERHYATIARELGIWLIPGSLYERRGDAVFNTAPVIDPAGRIVARYRKMFPWRPYEQGVTAGRNFTVFDVPRIGRFGVSVCYDGWFPEVSRSLAWLGAEVIIHPTLTGSLDRDVELAIARTNAVSNQCYFVDINVAGRLGNGRSIICGPGGEVIHEAGTSREVIAVELDLDYLRRCRRSGWNGLGQPLKGFRDSTVKFPCYGAGRRRSAALDRLGPVRRPTGLTRTKRSSR
jgi:deaminated glutathione amidase